MQLLPQLRVSADGHFFEDENGRPFFLLADTAWMLFNKLREEEIERLFANRAEKGFNAVLAVVFRDLFEPNSPNAYGIRPFASDADMTAVKLNPEWLQFVRRMVQLAGKHGLYMGLLPTWGDKWNEHSNSAGPVIMDREKARAYSRHLSDALGDCPNIFWVLGGDSPIQNRAYAATVQAFAEGLREGAGGSRLVTFHPNDNSTSEIFHGAEWLDFNAMQSGHARPNIADYACIERLHRLRPPKPCLNMEANFEACPMFLMMMEPEIPAEEPLYTAYDVRKCLYRSVLAGGAGFVYGCEPIRQLYREGDRIHVYGHHAMPEWKDVLDAPGSSQVRILPDLLRERSYFTREPAQELLLPLTRTLGAGTDYTRMENRDPAAHIRVARCREGNYLLAYTPVKQPVSLDTSGLRGEQYVVSVVNPENGEPLTHYRRPNTGVFTFVPGRDLDTFFILERRDGSPAPA